jgi:hypothetical protein
MDRSGIGSSTRAILALCLAVTVTVTEGKIANGAVSAGKLSGSAKSLCGDRPVHGHRLSAGFGEQRGR